MTHSLRLSKFVDSKFRKIDKQKAKTHLIQRHYVFTVHNNVCGIYLNF